MSQGTLHQLRGAPELVCRVQIDLGIDTAYVLCAPVVPQAQWGALVPKLHIAIDLPDGPHVILMSQLVALPASELGPVIGSAARHRDDIIAAVDLLVSGF